MKDNTNNKKVNNVSGVNTDDSQGLEKITLINPNETLVKKEEKSVVVRNVAGKLVRRSTKAGRLEDIYDLIQENEVFVRQEPTRVVVRNVAGKLVARKIKVSLSKSQEPVRQQKLKQQEVNSSPSKESLNDSEEEKTDNKEGLKERLLAKHAFLGRMERGQKVSQGPSSIPTSTTQAVSSSFQSDLVEEIEDDEEIEPDADVKALEDAVTEDKFNRTIGKGSSKGLRAGETGTFISGGAINPNEKPALKGTATAAGLVGNYTLAKPEKEPEIEEIKPKKIKKKRKPIKPWMIAVIAVSVYLVGMLTYFFIGYNFGEKKVNLVLYYIDIGKNAKLEYYDGEKFNSNDMLLTYYYSDDKIEEFRIKEENLAEPTVGMGYTLNNGYIDGLWVDSFASSSSRNVKVKFAFGNLICYVPVTIYRNKLIDLEKEFTLNSISAGAEFVPTIFGIYSNEILDAKNEKIKKQLTLDQFDLMLTVNGSTYNLKEKGCFDGTKYIFPEKIDEKDINYTSGVQLFAVVGSDGFNFRQQILIYNA